MSTTRGRRVIWSSDRQLIGRSFGPNEELDNALAGHVVTHYADPTADGPGKAEHQDLRHAQPIFVEIYVPVLDARGERVQAVIEFYKQPEALIAALTQLRAVHRRWAPRPAARSSSLALFGLVRRADRTIRSQQRQLVENETLAVIGEMSAAVAHGIRNPLASIRSSRGADPGRRPRPGA